MFLGLVALATCLTLSAAQLQIQPQFMAALPNLQPLQMNTLPNSQNYMTHTAHSILHQGTPLQPGLLGGLPVQVNEAAKNVLDQESRIVGYSISPEFAAVLQQQQQQQQNQQVQVQLPEQPMLQVQQQTSSSPPSPIVYQSPSPASEQNLDDRPELQQAQLIAEEPPSLIQYHRRQEQPPVASGGVALQSLEESQPKPQQTQLIASPPQAPIFYQPIQFHQQTAIDLTNTPQQILEEQQPQVFQQEQRPQVFQQEQRPQVFQQEQRPHVFQQKQQSQVLQQEHQPQVLQQEQQPQLFQQEQQLQVFQQEQQPQLFQQEQQLQVFQQEEQPQVLRQEQLLTVAPSAPLLYQTAYQQIPVAAVNAVEQPLGGEKFQFQHVQLQPARAPSQILVQSTPQLIPITPADAVIRNEALDIDHGQPVQVVQHQPQSITVPLINDPSSSQTFKVVPVRAMASLKNLINFGDKQSKRISPQVSLFGSKKKNPSRDQAARSSPPEASRIPIRKIAQNTRVNDIAYMRPPPFLRDSIDTRQFQNFRRPDDFSKQSRNQKTTYGQPPSEQGNNHQNRPQFTTTPPTPFDFPPENDDAIEIPAGRQGAGRNRIQGVQQASDSFHQQSFVRTHTQPQGYHNKPSSYSDGNSGYNNRPAYGNRGHQTVHKHIFVHAAPENYQRQGPRVRVIKPLTNNEKHVNIIFVKSPASSSPETQTIVELPHQEQPKTLVYILSKKPDENNEDVKVVGPAPTKPPAPEIYFIRYGENRGGTQDFPVPNLQSLLDKNNYETSSLPPVYDTPYGTDVPRSDIRVKRNRDFGLHVYAPLMAYSTTGQINEITQEEANFRRIRLDDFF